MVMYGVHKIHMIAVLSSSIKSESANDKTNQYTSSSKMLSGILPFSHSPAVNGP